MFKNNALTSFIVMLTCTLLTGVASAQVSKKGIFKVIQKSMHDISDCYKSELKKDETLHGKLIVSFIIEKHGAVERAEVKKTAIQSDGLKQCVIAIFKTMTFPQSDKITRVSYPLMFKKPSADSADQSKVDQAEKAKK